MILGMSRIKQKCEKLYIKMSYSEADLINWVSNQLLLENYLCTILCFISSEHKRVPIPQRRPPLFVIEGKR